MADEDDRLVFLEEDPSAPEAEISSVARPWRILIVDDDRDVHEATRFALRDVPILGRPVEFLHAYSGAEALEVLAHSQDIAIMLLDVVMETSDAGLRIVDAVRNRLKLKNLRIVLRTGQPGQAPEMEAIRLFDINDYKTKSELTLNKLFTTITAAVRSYDQLCRLDASRLGLEKIIAASNEFIEKPGLSSFAEGVITQIAGLVGIDAEGLVCAAQSPSGSPATANGTRLHVIAAAGKYSHFIDRDLDEVSEQRIGAALKRSLRERRSLFEARSVTLFFEAHDHHAYAAFVDAEEPIPELDQHLLEVFCTNISLCANNIELVSALRDQAFFDRLVQLPNRASLVRKMNQALDGGDRPHQALALVDVDQFSSINDIFGHRYGDQLLVAVADRLRADFPQCFLARVAGDIFGLLGRHDTLTPATITKVFGTPFSIDKVDHPLSVSIGVVHLRDVNGDGSDGLQNAHIALKRAKSSGMGHSAYYSEAIANETRERGRLLNDLHRALLQGGQLFTAFQPQIDVGSGKLVGTEALLRWQRADGSFVPPVQFIPIAEHSSLIIMLGEWVLSDALRSIKEIHRSGHDDLRVAVNVSVVQLAQPDFLDRLDRALREHDVAPHHLELEITESVTALGIRHVVKLLADIRARGIAIAIDDFGTGFSSLSYLNRLPADRIKIDRSFIQTLDKPQGARIAEMIVPLGHHLGLTVLAEGVETEAQLDALQALGCDEAQGYLLAQPMPLGKLKQWLECGDPIRLNPGIAGRSHLQ